MINYQKHIISHKANIKKALEQINVLGKENLTLFVIDEYEKLIGALTDGDIRRSFLEGITLNDSVEKCMFKDFRYLQKGKFDLSQIDLFREKGIKLIPIVDENFKLLRLINLDKQKSILPLDAVIMAGGRGKRLKPLTDSTPKPLLKVGEKPIIEYNIDRLIDYGIEYICLTINYLGEQLQDYFKDGNQKSISIDYAQENEPLGTAGALKLVPNLTQNAVLLMNSDILTSIDFEDFYRQFIQQDADMLVAAVPYQVNIPYGVLETQGNEIKALKEKPTYTYYSNAGIYILKKEALDEIPENQFFDATDLIEKLIQQNKKVMTYPLLAYWLDIGKPEDFEKAQQDIKHLNL